MKKLAFCFLIYDTIINEELWEIFFRGIDKAKYNIYIHYKVNVPLKYFEQYKVKETIETKYADVSLIHAHNLLFKKAYEDGCDKMINVTQSCIPLKSFDYVYNFLTKDDFSHFNVTPQSQCFPRCNDLLKYYDNNTIQKSSDWYILNRKCCHAIINYPKEKINEEYQSISYPEEHFYITLMHKYGLQNEIIATPNLADGATTFTNWEGMDYKYPSTRGLKNYTYISEEELLHLVNSKALFGRKFQAECAGILLNNRTYINAISMVTYYY